MNLELVIWGTRLVTKALQSFATSACVVHVTCKMPETSLRVHTSVSLIKVIQYHATQICQRFLKNICDKKGRSHVAGQKELFLLL